MHVMTGDQQLTFDENNENVSFYDLQEADEILAVACCYLCIPNQTKRASRDQTPSLAAMEGFRKIFFNPKEIWTKPSTIHRMQQSALVNE